MSYLVFFGNLGITESRLCNYLLYHYSKGYNLQISVTFESKNKGRMFSHPLFSLLRHFGLSKYILIHLLWTVLISNLLIRI